MKKDVSSVDDDFDNLNPASTFTEFVEADDNVATCGELLLDNAIAEALPGVNATATSVIDGMDTLEELEKVPVNPKYRPLRDVKLNSVTIHANPFAQ
ncbi:hypothetical protein HPB50_010283 [Hyalomma asiaticum]|uniref:Uncharacterized protein n=1 Tax=Hyalomma asiaticum TaxID=266040 RepID=A0ACB7TFW7_HYAAI|nr:hypothetical protein HPB50_010283 [Hyalomma asiaticum]